MMYGDCELRKGKIKYEGKSVTGTDITYEVFCSRGAVLLRFVTVRLLNTCVHSVAVT
jgi:hypothetical protein